MNRASLASLLMVGVLTGPAPAQGFKDDPEWVKQPPAVGDKLPELTVYTADGKEFKTSSLRGQYAVLAFGCLT